MASVAETKPIPNLRKSSSADTGCRSEWAKRSNFQTSTTVALPLSRVAQRLIKGRSPLRRPGNAVVCVYLLHRPAPVLCILPQFMLLSLRRLVVRGNAGVNRHSRLLHNASAARLSPCAAYKLRSACQCRQLRLKHHINGYIPQHGLQMSAICKRLYNRTARKLHLKVQGFVRLATGFQACQSRCPIVWQVTGCVQGQ